jgi:hypothetical protein
MRISQVTNKDRSSLKLAGTAALKTREMSPLSKLKQTRGIASTKRVSDNFEVRNALAQKEYPKSGYRYS